MTKSYDPVKADEELADKVFLDIITAMSNSLGDEKRENPTHIYVFTLLTLKMIEFAAFSFASTIKEGEDPAKATQVWFDLVVQKAQHWHIDKVKASPLKRLKDIRPPIH